MVSRWRGGLRGAVVWAVVTGGLLGSPGRARADIQQLSLEVEHEGACGVKLVPSFVFKGTGMYDCDVLITRYPAGSEQHGHVVAEGDLGAYVEDCRCGSIWLPPPDDATAVGLPCPGPPDLSAGCPEGFWCYCDRTCPPVYDSPPGGAYEYVFEPNGTFEWPTRATALFSQSNSECGSPGGCGCRVTGPGGHVLVLLLFLLGWGVPTWWRRR